MSWSKWDGIKPIDADTFLERVRPGDLYLCADGGIVHAEQDRCARAGEPS